MAGPLLSALLTLLLSLALGAAGREAQNTGERIVNGVPCPSGSQPWQVALFQGDVFECAGVLVHEQWVLTVAHCYMREYVVQVGSNLLFAGTAQKITATDRFTHPKFDPATNVHDLMLLKLSSPVKLSSAVKTVDVPSRCKQPGTSCTVSGWGRAVVKIDRYPSERMCLNVKFLPYKDCRKFYPTVLRKSMMCAAPPDGRSFLCKGDGGSPVTCDGTLQGLLSSEHDPCSSPFDPVVFTRVCKYHKWIYETIANNS